MVNDPIILESIGPDFVSSLARPSLFSSGSGLYAGATLRVESVKSSDYRNLSILSVSVLRFRHPLLLDAGGQVDTLDATAHLVPILTTRTTTLEYLRAKVFAVLEEIGGILLSFVAEYGNGDCTRMHPASPFRGWHPLNTVTTRFGTGEIG